MCDPSTEDVDGDGTCGIGDCQAMPPTHYDYDAAWMMLHAAAAAACRGSTNTGGSGCCGNLVRVRNTNSGKTCSTICSSYGEACDAEVSIAGFPGKATSNGQLVGTFYNYTCSGSQNGGSEATASQDAVLATSYNYLSYCCCRDPR